MSAVCGFAGNYAYVSACFNLSMFACFSSYFLQLLFGCSLTFTVSKASISSSFIAKSAYGCSSAIHNNIACCYTAACPNRAIAAADVYISVVIISCKFNIVFQSQTTFINYKIVFALFQVYRNCIVCICVNSNTISCSIFSINSLDSVFQAFACFIFIQCYIITGNQSSMLACFNSYLLQLCYVYSISVFAACCYIGNLTGNIIGSIPYRNSTSGSQPSRLIVFVNIGRSKSSGCTILACHAICH